MLFGLRYFYALTLGLEITAALWLLTDMLLLCSVLDHIGRMKLRLYILDGKVSNAVRGVDFFNGVTIGIDLR